MSQTENTTYESQNPEPPKPDPALKRRSRAALWKYGAARVVLFIALTVVIQLLAMAIGVAIPVLVSALLALFVALPLSMLIFSKWRVEAQLRPWRNTPRSARPTSSGYRRSWPAAK